MDEEYGHQWWCERCQKVGHLTRRYARQWVKRRHERGLRAYRCEQRGWHNGHTPEPVRRGLYTRDEWYALPWSVRKRTLACHGAPIR